MSAQLQPLRDLYTTVVEPALAVFALHENAAGEVVFKCEPERVRRALAHYHDNRVLLSLVTGQPTPVLVAPETHAHVQAQQMMRHVFSLFHRLEMQMKLAGLGK
jgi:hypothetical protein